MTQDTSKEENKRKPETAGPKNTLPISVSNNNKSMSILPNVGITGISLMHCKDTNRRVDVSSAMEKKRGKGSKDAPRKRPKVTTHMFPPNMGIKSGLYIIQCVENACTYVGESENVTARLNAHKNQLRREIHSNFKLQQDFNRYGEGRFVFQKLQFGFGGNPQTRLEFETILLGVLSPEKRYNTYVHWRTRSRETNPFFNRRHTPEARATLSKALSNRPSAFLNKKQSNLVKELISKHNSNGGNRKKGVYIDDVFYESVTEAWQKTGLSRRIIRANCHSEEQRHAAYRWSERNLAEESPATKSSFTIGLQNSTFNASKKKEMRGLVPEEMPTDVQELFYDVQNSIDELFELLKSKDIQLKEAVVNSLQAQLAIFFI